MRCGRWSGVGQSCADGAARLEHETSAGGRSLQISKSRSRFPKVAPILQLSLGKQQKSLQSKLPLQLQKRAKTPEIPANPPSR